MLEFIYTYGKTGYVSYREYANLYYGDFFNHTVSKTNGDGLIMSRPTDSFGIGSTRFFYLNFSPKYVMYSGWVGDEDPTFRGLKDAMKNMFHSAW